MAGRQNEFDSPERSVRVKKPNAKISILICIFVAALVIAGVFLIINRNINIHNTEETLTELNAAAFSAEKADSGSGRAQGSKHGIVLDDRKSMTLTGVKNVSDFNEQKIVLQTELGQLTITGRSLKLTSFSPKTGDLRLDGTIDSLVYADENKNTDSFWERIK